MARRHLEVERAVERGEYAKPNDRFLAVSTGLAILLGLALVVVILTAE